MTQGYDGPLPPYYVQSSSPTTPNLGLTLSGQDPIIAYNFVLIDTAVGAGGTSVLVNGVSVSNPNFNGTTPAAPASNTNVTFQVSGSSVSAYIPTVTQGPTGSGTLNTFPVWTAATVLGDNTVIATQGNATVDAANALILVNASPSTRNAILEIRNQFNSGMDIFTQSVVGNLGRCPTVHFYKSHGASLAASPLAVSANGDALGLITFGGYNGTAYSNNGVQIEADATEAWSSSAQGSALLIRTNANGATTLTNCFIRLGGTGNTFPAIKRSTTNANFRLADDSADAGIIASIVNATTGFQIAGAATTGNVLRGNGTNFVSSQLTFSDLSGNISVNQMNSGTNASASTFWRGDGTWVAAGTGTVTSIATSAPLAGGTITTTGTLSITGAAGQVLAGSTPAFTATPTLGTNASASGTLGLANGGGSGATVTLQNLGATSAYNWNLPTTAGSSGQVLTSQAGGSTSMTWSDGVPATSCVWSVLTNAAGNLTLANAGFTTTFNQTSSIAWTWANTTSAVVGTPQNSPSLVLSGQYFATGNVTGTDTWTIVQSLTAGLNGASTLNISHAGTTGTAAVAILNSLNVGATGAGGTITLFGATSGSNTFTAPGNGTQLSLSAATLAFASSANITCNGGASILTLTSANGLAVKVAAGSTNNIAGVDYLPSASFTDVTAGGQVHVQVRGTFAPTSGSSNFSNVMSQPTINQTGGANGTVRILAAYPVNTAVVGAEYLLALGTSSVTGPTATLTDQFLINNNGVVTNYAGTATVGQGVGSEIVTVDLTAQSAAIAATNLTASAPRTGMYRISMSATITTAATTSSVLGGTNGFQIVFTSPTDSVAKTTVAGNSVTSAANTTATAIADTITVYAKTGTAIQYSFDYTSVGVTAMSFELHLRLESL